jgi:hypothetical protein
MTQLQNSRLVAGLTLLVALSWTAGLQAAETPVACTLENQHVKYVIGANGANLQLIDKRDGKDYCGGNRASRFATIKKAGKPYGSSKVTWAEGRLTVEFGQAGVTAVIAVKSEPQCFLLDVVSVSGEPEELGFVNLPLTLKGTPEEPLAACVLGLNLQTNVPQLPRPMSHLRAVCYAKFGLVGAKAAMIVCPPEKRRQVMQEVVSAAPDLPHSPIGGPWAMGPAINQGSYLFNFGNMSEDKVDDWIKLVKSLGMNQIDFHGGSSFRFGDCQPNPKTYPRGFESLKAVIDKLHAAGISAGLHTYAFFIAKTCPWVTPVPDSRLAKDATLTLAEDLPVEAKTVPVVESTAAMSAVTGFFVRNSVTLQIDDELITYTGVSKEVPYTFTGCRRGACGTKVARHVTGAKVHHLKECFGLFVPDPETTLLAEVAAKTAEAYNTCGFDMIYLDALDGEDVLGGAQNGWHYGSKFTFEICKRLNKPALMEMSTFHHHLWYVRSRLGAWDHPNRSHKKFIDIHCEANEECRRMFLPAELGWWAVKTWTGAQGEPTFADDIEYLMSKGLGTDTGFALMGIDPDNISKIPALPRLAAIIKRYEDLRHSGKVPEAIKARLRVPGDEFTLTGSLETGWKFQPVQYAKHKVESAEPWSSTWKTVNKFDRQPVQLRIEALMAAGPYDAPNNAVVADFTSPADFAVRASKPGVTADLETSQEQVKAGAASGRLTASHKQATRVGTWTKIEKKFASPLNLNTQQALGVWVYGDGQGELLNIQLRSPSHLSHGIGDHYIPIDFTGWRYFELIEPEGERHADYQWPYGGIYAIYRESVNFGQVETVGLWYNNLPVGKNATCYLSPIKALPLVKTKLVNPTISLGNATITFPVEIESGSYLEFTSMTDCKLYGPKGELTREVTPQGQMPTLERGENEIRFRCEGPAGVNPRARVTVIGRGNPL